MIGDIGSEENHMCKPKGILTRHIALAEQQRIFRSEVRVMSDEVGMRNLDTRRTRMLTFLNLAKPRRAQSFLGF